MATSSLIPVSEYLSTTYRPDRDYIDGELKERNVGEQPHAHVEGIITAIFHNNRKAWGVRSLPEQRLQISSSRYRIPDVCIVRNTDSKERIITFAPLLCIEILSADDSLRDLQLRVDDYLAVGVQAIWAIDPWKRRGYCGSANGFRESKDGLLKIDGTAIAVSLADIFAQLDEF